MCPRLTGWHTTWCMSTDGSHLNLRISYWIWTSYALCYWLSKIKKPAFRTGTGYSSFDGQCVEKIHMKGAEWLNLPKIVWAKIVSRLSWILYPEQEKGLGHLACVCDLYTETATMKSRWLLRINPISAYKSCEDAIKAAATSLLCRRRLHIAPLQNTATWHSNLHFCAEQSSTIVYSPLLSQAKARTDNRECRHASERGSEALKGNQKTSCI